MSFKIEVSEKISLVMPELSDAKKIYDVVNEDREHLRIFLVWVDKTTDVSHSEENIKSRIKDFDEGKAAAFLIKLEDEFIGSVGFIEIDKDHNNAEIGYWLSSKYTGKRLMTDCVRAVIEYGFKELKLHRIIIRCNSENTKSSAIPKRLGFTFEGTLRDDKREGEKYRSTELFSLLEGELK